MRRGKINKLSYFLIILSAIFTVLSYVSDQVVIRFENDLRMKNIVYQDLDTKIKSLESTSTKLENLQIQSNDVINNELLQRNFWIKNLFIIESKKEYFKEIREELNVLIDEPFVIYNMKLRIQNSFWDLRDNIFDLQNAFLILFTEQIFEEINFFSTSKFLANITFDKTNNRIADNQDKFYRLNNLDELTKLLNAENFKNYELVHWWDLRNFRLLWIESFSKEIDKIDDINEYIIKVIDEYYLDLDIIFFEIKKKSNYKNYFILIGIISQILTLFFLLLLFRNLIKEKIF
tara:strand:+ start:223 stop:1092 length:870 start_codon:yes stop_codon:yes gene_type:complete